VRKIYGKYPEFSRSRIGQRNGYGISLYDFAYVRCNRPQDLPQVKLDVILFVRLRSNSNRSF
jgi:hypothetical protein